MSCMRSGRLDKIIREPRLQIRCETISPLLPDLPKSAPLPMEAGDVMSKHPRRFMPGLDSLESRQLLSHFEGPSSLRPVASEVAQSSHRASTAESSPARPEDHTGAGSERGRSEGIGATFRDAIATPRPTRSPD